MSGAIPPLPQYIFTVWFLVKHSDNFTFGYLMTLYNFVSYVVWNGRMSMTTNWNGCGRKWSYLFYGTVSGVRTPMTRSVRLAYL
jgi:hypothetical protein